jgi:hypothetical protein
MLTMGIEEGVLWEHDMFMQQEEQSQRIAEADG